MSVKIENTEKNTVKLEITVDADKFNEAMNRSFKKNAGKFSIPGFRKGKAPMFMIERHYGEQVFYEDAIDFIVPETYQDAVAEAKIEPVSKPEIDFEQIEKGKDFIYTAVVTVKPEVKLGKYKGVEIEETKSDVSKEDVEKEIEKVREQNARIITVEDRSVKKDDIAVIDFEGFIGDVPFEGGKGTNHHLTIGSGQFIPGFEDQIIGKKKDEEFDVTVTFPEDYQSDELKGKEAVFKVKINEIKEKELPAADDEFAQDISEFDTFSDYEKDLEEKLKKQASEKAKAENENKVIEKAAENMEAEIPEIMFENRIDEIIREFEYRLMYQGLNIEKYLELTKTTMEDMRGQYKEQAEKDVKARLLIEKVMETEKIDVTEEELEEKYIENAKNAKKEVEEYKKNLTEDNIEYMKNNIKVLKTVDFLLENAKKV